MHSTRTRARAAVTGILLAVTTGAGLLLGAGPASAASPHCLAYVNSNGLGVARCYGYHSWRVNLICHISGYPDDIIVGHGRWVTSGASTVSCPSPRGVPDHAVAQPR